MPSKAEHLDKAEHNEHFASRLNQDGNYVNYRDWVVTGYFYSAVHYVEAYLATKSPPVHSENHPARDTTIGSDGVLQQIYDEYRALKDDSTNARYMMVMPTPITVANYVQPNHEKIKSYLLAHIP
jgi:hypothetical protein